MYNISTHMLKWMLSFNFFPTGQCCSTPLKALFQCVSRSSMLNEQGWSALLPEFCMGALYWSHLHFQPFLSSIYGTDRRLECTWSGVSCWETINSYPMDMDLVSDEEFTTFGWPFCGLKCILSTSAFDNGHLILLIRKGLYCETWSTNESFWCASHI